MVDPNLHQSFQDFPRLGTRFVDPENGLLAAAWYRLLITLWRRTGNAFPITQQAIILQRDSTSGEIQVVETTTGTVLGILNFSGATGGPPQNVAIGTSPSTVAMPKSGMLIASTGQSEISRDAGATFYVVSLTGGPIPVIMDDIIRMTWFSTTKPILTLFPTL